MPKVGAEQASRLRLKQPLLTALANGIQVGAEQASRLRLKHACPARPDTKKSVPLGQSRHLG